MPRSTIRATTVAVAVAAVAAFAAPGEATACTCVRFAPGEALRSATHVFAGTAISTRAAGAGRRATVTAFRVDARVKGRVRARPSVVAPIDEASCGYRFRVGRRYLVFARRDGRGPLTTNVCSGTRAAPRGRASGSAGCPAVARALAQLRAAVQSASSPRG